MSRTIALLVLAGLALAATACGGGDAGEPVSYEVEQLETGEPVSVASLAGQPALLVSWATWCRECDEELAGLQAFAESPDADGIEIVAVNLDAGNVEDEIDAKVAEHGLTTELWRDRRNDFKSTFGALGVPTTVLLDADGAVVELFPGAVDFEDDAVTAALDQLRSS
jgi:peroxiredoxin